MCRRRWRSGGTATPPMLMGVGGEQPTSAARIARRAGRQIGRGAGRAHGSQSDMPGRRKAKRRARGVPAKLMACGQDGSPVAERILASAPSFDGHGSAG
jgi:hypothetical protein